MFLSLGKIVKMTEYFKDIEQARNITEIKEILYLVLYLVHKKYFTSLTSVFALLDAYQGKYRQVGHRFKQLKENMLKKLRGIFT